MKYNGTFSPNFTQQDNQQQQIQNLFTKEDSYLVENTYNQRVQELLECQKIFQNEERFYEAEKAKCKILELKQTFVQKNFEEKNYFHLEERIQIEKGILQEFVSFNIFWDQKMQDYNILAEDMKKNLIQKQQQQNEIFEQKLAKELDTKFKESPQLLKLRAVQETLAKKENYLEAGKIKQQIIQLEKNEYEKFKKKQQVKKELTQQQIDLTFQKDKDNLEKKKVLAEDELRKLRCQELEKLLIKFQSTKEQVLNQQQKEVNIIQKFSNQQDKYFLTEISSLSGNTILQEKKNKCKTPTKILKY